MRKVILYKGDVMRKKLIITICFLAAVLLSGCGTLGGGESNYAGTISMPVPVGVDVKDVIDNCYIDIGDNGFVKHGLCNGNFKKYFDNVVIDKVEEMKPGGTHDKGEFSLSSKIGIEGVGGKGDVAYYSEYLIKKQYAKIPKLKIDDMDIEALADACRLQKKEQYIVESVNVGCSITAKVKKGEVDAKYLANLVEFGGNEHSLKKIGLPLHFRTLDNASEAVACGSPKVISVNFTSVSDMCSSIKNAERNFFKAEIVKKNLELAGAVRTEEALRKSINFLEESNGIKDRSLTVHQGQINVLSSQLENSEGDVSDIARLLAAANSTVLDMRGDLNSKRDELRLLESELSNANGRVVEAESRLVSESEANDDEIQLLSGRLVILREDILESRGLIQSQEIKINEYISTLALKDSVISEKILEINQKESAINEMSLLIEAQENAVLDSEATDEVVGSNVSGGS